jgi:hypothetical protein
MTSTLTGPFDLCVELTDTALSAFASSIFRDKTQPISIPHDNQLSLVGQAVLDIQSASIVAAPSSSQPAGATVTITFVDSSLAFSSPQTAFAEPLSGTIVVSGVPFALVPVAGGQQDLELDFTATSVSAQIHWTGNELDDSVVPAVNKAGKVNLGSDVIAGFLNTEVANALQNKVGKQKISGAVLQMAPPGKDGTLSPPTFTEPGVVVTRAKTDKQPGVLGILATIFKSDDAPSQPPPVAGKTATATDSSHTGSLTISQDGFQNIFIFEANKKKQVPPGTSITTTLEEGKIGLHLAGTQGTAIYTANWTIDGDMLASVSNGALALQLTNVVEHVSVSLSWWVWVSEIGLGGAPLAGLVAEIQAQVKDEAMTLVQNAVSTLTTDIGQSSTAISGIPITFDHVDVHTQGIVMQGMAQLPPVFGTFVQGIVTDPNEVPIPGATVIINPDGESGLYTETTTDQNGRYTFEAGGGANLDVFSSDPNGPEPYPITAAQPEYVTGTEQVSINWGQIVTKDFVLQPVKDITVKGQVLGNGTPLEGAIVTLSTVPDPNQVTVGTSKPSDKQGMYTLTTNPGQTFADAFTVSATAPGFNTQAMPIGLISNGGTVTENFTLATPHPFTVTGTVTGSYGLHTDPTVGAVADAKITVFPKTQPSPPLPTATGQTQTNGSYSVGPVNPGSYSGDYLVLVEAKLFEVQKVDVSQPTGASVEVDVELSPVPSKVPGPPVKPGTAM